MISRLVVRDFVRIRELELELGPGLNVLSGASGEGKSLLLEALAFALGEGPGGREAAERWVRAGAAAAEVCLEVTLAAGLRRRLAEAGLDPAVLEGERLRVERQLDAGGRTRARAGGRAVTQAVLRRVGAALVERFRQGQAYRLLEADAQRELLDGYAGVRADAARYAEARQQALTAARERDRSRAAEARARELQATFADERALLARLAPRAGELDELHVEQLALEAGADRRGAVTSALAALTDDDGAPLERLRGVLRRLERDGCSALEQARRVFADGLGLLDEAGALLEAELDRLEGEPARLAWVRERLAAYQDAARRLGVAPAGVAARWADLDGAQLEALAARRTAAEEALAQAWDELDGLGAGLVHARARAGKRLAPRAEAALQELGLPEARFTVEVAGEAAARPQDWREVAELEPLLGATHPSPAGPGRVRFAFSPDGLAAPGPLERASGGELSRVFLALGAQVADREQVPLLIVDEVDQNVGARLGEAVGRCLVEHARGRQVLAVTHLAPVAARASRHLRVRKGRRGVQVDALEAEARLEELALMLQGRATAGALAQARELLQDAGSARGRRPTRRAGARRGRVVRAAAG